MPIYWSFHSITGLAGSPSPAAVNALLGQGEQRIYGDLSFAKRRTEWLGGRLSVKELVCKSDPRLEPLALNQIEILNENSGAPRLVIQGGRETVGSVSLSHSHGHVFAMFSPDVIPLGADLEFIEPRAKEFVEDYFTPEEIRQVNGLPIQEQPLWVTLTWSAKEAALKALSLGLHVDTRSVQVLFPEAAAQPGGWNALGLESPLVKKDSLHLFWRREADFVLTACIPAGWKGRMERVDL